MIEDTDGKAGLVWVQRQPNAWHQAAYHVDDITGLHWTATSGGVGVPLGNLFLAGYVRCDSMVSGELDHSGIHGACPHSIKIIITKAHNDPALYAKLAAQAGEKPQLDRNVRIAINGRRYHRRKCPYLPRYRRRVIRLSEARARGLMACKACKPPE